MKITSALLKLAYQFNKAVKSLTFTTYKQKKDETPQNKINNQGQ